MNNKISFRTNTIKKLIKKYGFVLSGFSKATFLEKEADYLEKWLKNGNNGSMGFLANHFDKRLDPRKLVDGAKTVISLAYNYHNPQKQIDPNAPKISSYAYGRDYHKVVKNKLVKLFKEIKAELGDINGRCFVDSGPVMERDWAKRSGLGWIGKNTLLINKDHGSNFYLSEIIIDVELEYDNETVDHCGTCTKCIDACPTDAISDSGYILDAKKCISYLTIELKEEIPKAFSDKMDNWMFGCDICQDVCPWNRFSTPHSEPDFNPKDQLMNMSKRDWVEITEELFDDLFFGSPVKRAKFEGLKRNIDFLTKD